MVSDVRGKDGGRKMTNAEAIETLRANYPDACFEQLREAVDAAIEALKAQDAVGDTISRQAAIDQLHQSYNLLDAERRLEDLPSAQPDPHYDEWCMDCKEYDKDRHCCPRWNRVIRQTLKDTQPAPQWIPCSERQPEDGVRVLIMHGDCIEFGRYEDGEWMWLCESGTNYWEEAGKVDAWMPLPEPYQAERKDE